MTDTFVPIYAPTYGTPVNKEYSVLENSFGDGYEQTVPDGLNTIKETWEVSWNNLAEVYADEIEDQLDTFAGAPFFWETPKGLTKKFKCKKLTKVYVGYQAFTVSATFVESFS